MTRRTFWLCVAAIAASLGIYAAVVVRNFKGPIGDHSESFLYEYLSYYVSKNLSFSPLPHLGLDNDQAFYPFGTDVALQSFCVERDLFFSAISRLGRGPWLQIYYLGGLVIAAYGTFALLRKDHGDVRAALVAIGSTCLNFYGGQKYPYHFNIACVHWTTLGIVCDFVIVERLVMRRTISVELLLVRVLLVVLAFGLELGHVLGYSLTSALATAVFAAWLLAARAWLRRRGREQHPSDLARFGREARIELARHAPRIAGLLVAIVVFALLYGSIVGQIVRETKRYDFTNVPLGVWWSQPVRLFIPYTPWLHPSMQPELLRLWGDQAEVGIGSGGAGVFLLALGALGLAQAKDKLRWAPLFATFVAYVVSRPGFDLVRWMPWFAFTRVLSRATVVYSTILALFALGIDLERFAPRARKVVYGALGVTAAIELYTFATIKVGHPAFAFDDAFLSHMKAIEALPGEAVLDFPFCILGGNGDLAYLCPYSDRLRSVYALQRFHHKKVIGQYLGRVHPTQTQPFVDEGWPKMWDPDDPDPLLADHQIRCLTEPEWAFFADFYEKNDFSGIQLAVDRLPPGCDEQFYARFGRPMGVVTIPKAGRLAFIPRDPASFARLDKEGAKHLRLSVELTSEVEVVSNRHSVFLDVSGVSGWECLGPAKNPTAQWRWALAPATELSFEVGTTRQLTLAARFRTPIQGQSIDVEVDGRRVTTWDGLPSNEEVTRTVSVAVAPGKHLVRLIYAKANGKPDVFAPDDPRPMTVMLASLTLRADPVEK